MTEDSIRPRFSVGDATDICTTLRKIVVNNLFTDLLTTEEENDLRILEVKLQSLLDNLKTRTVLRDLRS